MKRRQFGNALEQLVGGFFILRGKKLKTEGGFMAFENSFDAHDISFFILPI
jgi:hypothetical protein